MTESSCERYQDELLALQEGWLEEEAAERVRGHLDTCAACRSEYEWLEVACADLEVIGDATVKDLPKVNLIEGVMAAVARVEAPVGRSTAPKNVVSLRAKREEGPKKQGFASGFWAGLAVAAALLLVAGLAWKMKSRGEEQEATPRVAQRTPGEVLPGTSPDVDAGRKSPEAIAAERGLFEKVAEALSKEMAATRPPRLELPREIPASTLASVKASDVIAARRDAVNLEGGWARLMEYAALAPEAARAVTEMPDASPAAVVGAASSLGAEDAAEVLVTVMGHYGDDPAVRMAAAKAFGDQSEPSAQVQETQQLLAVQQADPQNGLPGYMRALQLLEEGSVAEALNALLNATNPDKLATAYALQNASYQEAALIAAGMDPEAARLTAAMTVGMDESVYLNDLADGLLAEGAQLLEAGDVEGAGEVFDAVQRFGEQVAAGALTSQEQLAGLDIQRRAIETYYQHSASLDPEGEQLDGLVADATALVDSIGTLSEALVALDQLFFSEMAGDLWTVLSALFLTEGDLAVLQNPEAYPSVTDVIEAALSASTSP